MHTLNIPADIQEKINANALVVLNHSGGKDSQAMTILVERAVAAGHINAEQILVVHAELPGVDWDGIPEHIVSTVDAAWSIKYCRATKTFFDMVNRRAISRPDAPAWPSPKYRQCTSDLKRGPIAKLVRHHLKANPQHNGLVVHLMGLRAEESSARAKAKVTKLNARESVAGRQVFEWLPIHDMTEVEVFALIAVSGQRPHEAYAAGMSRLSCCFCIMSSKRDLQTAAKLRPDLLEQYSEIEGRVGSTMSMTGIPLRELVLAS